MKVLFIEDVADDKFLIERQLKHELHISATAQVETEQELLSQLEQTWDVVICDYQMPEFNALLAIPLIKRIQPDLPIIVVSGVVDESFAVEVMRAGAQDFVTKGNLSRLIPAVKRGLASAEQQKNMRQVQGRLHLLSHAIEKSMNSMMLIKLGERGEEPHVTYCNDAFYEMAGLQPQDVLDKPISALKEGIQAGLAKSVALVLQEGQSRRREVMMKTPEGVVRWLDASMLPVKNEQGKITHVVAVALDISDRKEKDLALQRLNSSLKERFRNLRSLHGIQARIAENAPLEDVLAEVAKELLEHPAIVHVGFLRFDSVHDRFVKLHSSSAASEIGALSSIINSELDVVDELHQSIVNYPQLIQLDLQELKKDEQQMFDVIGQARDYYLIPLRDHGLLGVLEIFCDYDILDLDQQFPDHHSSLMVLAALALASQSHRDHMSFLVQGYRDLADFGAAIESTHDVTALLKFGLRRLIEHLGFDAAMYMKAKADTMTLVAIEGDVPAGLGLDFDRPMPLMGMTGRCIREDRLVYAPDYSLDQDARHDVKQLGARTVLNIPVRHQARVVGVIGLSSFTRNVLLRDVDFSIARSFVNRLENALERVTHLEEIMTSHKEISATRDATFRALGLALEFRDLETKGHTDHVVALSSRFAEALDFTTETEPFLWGAYFHDVGKIGIPDSILLKPGKLTEEEWRIMKNHTIYGAEMCQDIPFLPAITRNVVRSHHERWDGSGYPDGLAGEAIPLCARMFSLVDVYDALVSERPYKKAWTHEEAMAEIQRQSGKQFDPELVRVFARLFETPLAAKSQAAKDPLLSQL